jgi:hypothetical protein
MATEGGALMPPVCLRCGAPAVFLDFVSGDELSDLCDACFLVFLRWNENLGRGLATAGALCAAFIEGTKQGIAALFVEIDDLKTEAVSARIAGLAWFPGCGTPAP